MTGFMKNLTFQILIVLFAGSITVEATADPSAPYSRLLRAFTSNAIRVVTSLLQAVGV
jgi:hypothetical protein